MAENPFVDRMNQLVSDSTDAKRIEHFQSVAELQEKNKQRVKELIEKDNQRLEQIEKSEEILLSDALEAVNEITPEMMTKDGSISFVSEAFAFIERKGKSQELLRNTRENLAFRCGNTAIKYNSLSLRRVTYSKDLNPMQTIQYSAKGNLEKGDRLDTRSYSRDCVVHVSKRILQNDYGFGKKDPILNFIISPNGKTVVLQQGTSLRFVSVRTKKMYMAKSFTSEPNSFDEMAYSPDGKFIAISRGKDVYVLNAWTGEQTAKINNEYQVLSMVFHPTLPVLIIAGGYHFTCFDQESRETQSVKSLDHMIWAIAISPDGKLLAVGGKKYIRLYDFGNFDKHKKFVIKLGKRIESILFNPLGVDELEGFFSMWEKVQRYISKSGLVLSSGNLTDFKLSWKRQVDF